MLILLRGKPGTGKSTLSDALGRRLGAAVIDKDDVKDVLDARYRDEHVGGMTYDVMLRVAERCLRQGIPVICDSPLTFPDLYERTLAMAERHGTPVVAIRTVCSDHELWSRRLAARTDMPEHRVKSADDPRIGDPRYAIEGEVVIDTVAPLEACVEEVLARCGMPQPA